MLNLGHRAASLEGALAFPSMHCTGWSPDKIPLVKCALLKRQLCKQAVGVLRLLDLLTVLTFTLCVDPEAQRQLQVFSFFLCGADVFNLVWMTTWRILKPAEVGNKSAESPSPLLQPSFIWLHIETPKQTNKPVKTNRKRLPHRQSVLLGRKRSTE